MGSVVNLNALNRDNYDIKYSVNEKEIRCYSRDELEKQYPEKNYVIIGETFENNKKEKIATVMLGGKVLNVSEPGKNFKPFFRHIGYIEVGKNAYLALLKSQKPFALLCSSLICGICAAAATMLVIWLSTPAKKLDFILPPEDAQATTIEHDHSQKKKSNGGGSVSLGYSLEAYADLISKDVTVLLQNPNASNKDMTATLYIQSGEKNIPIARSGLVKSGKELKTMTLMLDGISLQNGTYNGYFLLDFYDPDSGEKALMNSKIDHVKIIAG